jgi:hypothetical protein
LSPERIRSLNPAQPFARPINSLFYKLWTQLYRSAIFALTAIKGQSFGNKNKAPFG